MKTVETKLINLYLSGFNKVKFMSLESFIELLNSPTGKKLDRMAKRMLLRKALPILLMSTGLDDIAEIAQYGSVKPKPR